MSIEKTQITVSTTINAPVNKVWQVYNTPADIIQWNTAHPDWHTPKAENDLRPGGNFSSRMEAKDGSFGFDFHGTYDEVVVNQLITYTMGDSRKAKVVFDANGDETTVTTTFEAEDENPAEMQREGWQAILNNFKQYVEAN